MPTPTPAPTPTPSIADLKTVYRGDVDVRELYKNISKYQNWKLRFSGRVLNVFEDKDGTFLQLTVDYGSGFLEDEVIDYYFDPSVDMDGIYKESQVTVWGRPFKMTTITNAYGGDISQPLLAGDYIELD